MDKIIIRNEKTSDYSAVEKLTRDAFWNQNVPGCSEHYFVHVMREHSDFVKELALVLEKDGEIIANVMYLLGTLVDEEGNQRKVLSFGPLSVKPEYQRQGYGKRLLEYSFDRAIELGYDAIVIFGNPDNYVARGFKSCKRYNICLQENLYPAAMLVKELKEGTFDLKKLYFRESEACNLDMSEVEAFDKQFEPKEKEFKPSQEEFYIHSHSILM